MEPSPVAELFRDYSAATIKALVPRRILPLELYVPREIESEVQGRLDGQPGHFCVILGDAGVGKTSLSCFLGQAYLDRPEYAPLLLQGDELVDLIQDRDLGDSISYILGKKESLSELLWAAKNIEHRHPVLILDTLDLIIPTAYEGLLRLVILMKRLGCAILGTSRTREYLEYGSEIADDVFRLKPLDDPQLDKLTANLSAFYNLEGHSLHGTLREACRNPLRLKMLFESFQGEGAIPSDAPGDQLYQKYWHEKVDLVRPGTFPGADRRYREQISHDKAGVILDLAFECVRYKAITLRASDKERLLHSETRRAAYGDLVSESVLREEGDRVEFFHQDFWEFAAAKSIASDSRRIDAFLHELNTPIFRGVARELAIFASKEGRSDIYIRLMDGLQRCSIILKSVILDVFVSLQHIDSRDATSVRETCRADPKMMDYLLQLVLAEEGRKHAALIFDLIEQAIGDDRANFEVYRRVSEALPYLVEVDTERASGIFRRLRSYYNPEKRRTDIRRRVLEAVPTLYRRDPPAALDLLRIREKDSPFTVMAAVESIFDLVRAGSLKRDGETPWEQLGKLQPIDRLVVEFMWDLLEAVTRDSGGGLDRIRELLATPAYLDEVVVDDRGPVRKICVARVLPRLSKTHPEGMLDLMVLLATKDEHRNVRRAIAKSLPDFLGMAQAKEAHSLVRQKADQLAVMLARDGDELIAAAITDMLPLLLRTWSDLAARLSEILINSNHRHIVDRVRIILVKLIAFYPERAGRYQGLINSVS